MTSIFLNLLKSRGLKQYLKINRDKRDYVLVDHIIWRNKLNNVFSQFQKTISTKREKEKQKNRKNEEDLQYFQK